MKKALMSLPTKQQSKVVASLIEEEIEKRELELYQCAKEIEADEALNREMKDWEVTLEDGIESETW